MGSSAAYTANGHVEVPANFDKELGSAAVAPVRELVPELGTRIQATKVYDKMARTDVTSGVALRAAKVPILGADFYIDPMGDQPANLDAAEFVTYNLFSGMSSPWSYVLTRILKMYQHGFSVLEPVYQRGTWSPTRKGSNNKQYTMLRKLAYRPALTIKDIEYDDNGGPVDIIHTALRKDGKSEDVTIPIAKAIVFPFGEANDLFGESVLRTAYANWYYKTFLYKIDAIQKERHGIGVPMGKLPPNFKDSDKIAMDSLLSNLRTNERAHITLPPGYEVSFAKVEGNLVDVLASAGHHDVLILMNVFAQFLMLGLGEQSGSRAVSGAQLDIFYKSEWFVAQTICEYMNQFLIPNLVLYNFQVDTLPQMKVRNIGHTRDLQQLAAALANLLNSNLLTPDMELENWGRELVDAPMKKEPRPAISDTDVQERINVQRNENPDGTPAKGTTGPNAGQKGQGNTGKSPTET